MNGLLLSDDAKARVAQFAEQLAAEEVRFSCLAAVLDYGTEAEIVAFAKEHSRDNAALTLATTYRDWRPDDHLRELHCIPYQFHRHPRRPVLMRGARDRMIAIHSWGRSRSANGYAAAVIDRYFRMLRFTCFDRAEIDATVQKIRNQIAEKYPLSYHLDSHLRCRYSGPCEGFVGGKWRRFTEHQFNYLKKLHGIIRKTERLDRRAALLTANQAEPIRLAA